MNIPTKKTIFLTLPLIFLAVAVFVQVGNDEFIDYDDNIYVYENKYIKEGLTIKSFLWAFKTDYAANWHPLTWISHMLDIDFFGLDPGGHHKTNLIIHLLNSLLLFYLLYYLTTNIWQSIFTSALFSIHPLHVESVAQIAERKDLLCGLFFFLTIFCYSWYVKKPKKYRYILSITLYGIGLMAKPMIVTMPFVLMLLDFWPLKRLKYMKKSGANELINMYLLNRGLLFEKIPFFILCILSCIITFQVQQHGGAVASLSDIQLSDRIQNAFWAYLIYIYKMFFPVGLSFFYPLVKVGIIRSLAAFCFLCILTWFCFMKVREKPYLIVGWLWYIGTLVPVIGIVQVGGQSYADRYTYIPLVGLFIMISWGIPSVLRTITRKSILGAAFIIIFVLSCMTWVQTSYWSNSITLFSHAIEVTDSNVIAHNNMGGVLAEINKTNEAIKHYREVIEIKPNWAPGHNNLGKLLADVGNYQEGLMHLETALKLDPKLKKTYNNLGMTLDSLNRTDEAIKYYKKALLLDPEYNGAIYNMGVAYYKKHMIDDAIESFKTVLEKDPGYADAYNSLAVILVKKGKRKEGLALMKMALQLMPQNDTIRQNIQKMEAQQ